MTSANRAKNAVPAEQLRRACPPVDLKAADPTGNIGQGPALASVALGLKLSVSDYALSHYNIVVVGPPNTGRTAKTLQFIRRHAAGLDSRPPDVVCLPDPSAPRRPLVLTVANGRGRDIKKQLEAIGKYATKILPQKVALLRGQYQQSLQLMLEGLWDSAREKVRTFGYVLAEDENVRFLVPLSLERPEETMDKEEYDALSQDLKDKLNGEALKQAEEVVKETQQTEANLTALGLAERLKAEKQLVQKTVNKLTRPLRSLAEECPSITRYLAGLDESVLKLCLRDQDEQSEIPAILLQRARQGEDEAAVVQRLTQVNLLVDNSGIEHPPVVHVAVPQYSELFGRINAQVVNADGAIKVDHTMIEPGAWLKANGGFLVFDLEDLLRWGGVLTLYKMLEVIRTRTLAIEGKARFVDAESLMDFRPEDIPVNVRVVVICDRHLEQLMRYYEKEFDNLFRVIAEFDDRLDIAEAPAAYAAFVRLCQADGQLPEFTPTAVAKLVEYGSRRAEDQGKASAEFGILKDLITEAAHWAAEDGSAEVGPEHVRLAIDNRFERQALWIRHYQEDFLDNGKQLVEHRGAKIGQINGLVVFTLSPEISFGAPTRITARAFAGEEKVLLVQREAEVSGPSTNTATAVIRGYLSGQYGRKKPLSLAAQLCFEQCYGGIDGDSATLAEVVALISAITGLPVDQRLAMTGSMNQWGEAQPIGGANEKIEGHFEALRRRGLLGPGHGVVLPRLNLSNLMLREEVVEAQKQGLYQVYAVSHVDEALEIFLGRPAQEIHRLVAKRLGEIGKERSRLGTFFRRLFRRDDDAGQG